MKKSIIYIVLIVAISNICYSQIEYPKTDITEHNDSGLYIELNTDSLEVDKLINVLFGEIVIKSSQQIYADSIKKYKYIRVSLFEKGIFICDHSLGMEFTKEINSKYRNSISKFLKKAPIRMLSILAYESGGTYGYRLSEVGKVESAVYTHDTGYTICREGRALDYEIELMNNNQYLYASFNLPAIISESISLELTGSLILNETQNNHYYYVNSYSD